MPTANSQDDDRLSGKSSYILIDETEIPIVSYGLRGEQFSKSAMLSRGYSAGTTLFVPILYPTSVSTSVDVAGRFRFRSTPSQVIARLYDATEGPFPVILGLDAGNVVGHGDFVIRGFHVESMIRNTVNFTCTLMGSGLFYPNE